MRVDIFRERYGRFYQIIDHDIGMEIKVHSDGRITRNNGPVFNVCGDDPFVDWETFEQETGYSREQIKDEFRLAVKEY